MQSTFATPVAALLTVTVLAAQNDTPQTRPTSRPAGFDAFVDAVDAAHRGERAAATTFDGFVGKLSIVSESEEQRIEVRLEASFRAPDRLRYRVLESGRELERGRDALGAWMRNGDHVVPLPGRQFQNDLRELNRHVRLARQLLRFLDPAGILRTLEDPAPVTERELRIGRMDRGACRYTSGILSDFPMFATEGKARTVKLEIWTQDGKLNAIRATPLDDRGRPAGAAELVLLDDYQPRDGVEIPTKLRIFEQPPAPGRGRAIATIEISKLELAPNLEEADFRRPK